VSTQHLTVFTGASYFTGGNAMKGHNRFPALAVAVWIMAGSMVTEANASGGRAGGNMGRLLKGLNLTTGQKHRTEGIVQEHHSDLVTGKMAVLQARQNLLTVMTGERLDEKVVHAAYTELTAAEQNLTFLRAKILNEFMPVLTPDQQTTIKNKVAKISLRMQRSMAKLQSKLNSPLLSKIQDNEAARCG
jgi:Spy/CpxP family protein refolding chaperone